MSWFILIIKNNKFVINSKTLYFNPPSQELQLIVCVTVITKKPVITNVLKITNVPVIARKLVIAIVPVIM